VDPISRHALARVKDPEKAENDPMLKAMKAGNMPQMPPSLNTDVEGLAGYVKASA